MPYQSGIYSGLVYRTFPINTNNPGSIVSSIDQWIDSIITQNKIDSIVSIFMMPLAFVSDLESGYTKPKYIDFRVSRSDAVDLYIPRNKKLLTFPYKFLSVDTLSDSHIYRYEFSNQTDANDPEIENPTGRKQIAIKMICALNPNPEIVCAPMGYNASVAVDGDILDVEMPNYTESVTVSGYPQCAIAVDAYKAWLAQNGNGSSQALSIVGTALGSAAAIAFGGPVGMAGGILGGLGIANTLNQLAIAQTMGSKARGNQGNAPIMGDRHLGAYFKQMSVNRQQARIIDNFFDRYGYNSSQLKLPNRHVRTHWTYCKTNECSLHGNLPAEAIVRLKNIYNNGITFWDKNAIIGDYTQSNNVLTTP